MTRVFVGAAVTIAMAACASISGALNPDPVHGGDCKDGDQLGELCADGVTCCHPSAAERCGLLPGQCVPLDPAPDFGRPRDGGPPREQNARP